MVELTRVVFCFNQSEYETSTVCGGRRLDVAHRLMGEDNVFVKIVLNDKHGIARIETLTPEQARSCDEIWDAGPIKNKFSGNRPVCPRYEVKTKDGRIITAELRNDSFSSGRSVWFYRGRNEQIPADEIVGWRTV